MKSLNHKEISQAFNRFLTWFASLLLITITCVYSCVRASSRQSSQLIMQKEAFDRVFFTDAMLADKVDSLYTYMNLLNTSRIRDDRQMQRLITKKKEEFVKLVNQQKKTQQYFAVYNRLFNHIDEMLLLKDSLNRAMAEETNLKDELRDCSDHYEQTREADRQRRQTGAF